MAAPGKGAPSESSKDFHWGERIGKYQIITQLSVGGMAELFLGFTSGPGGFRKYVAIKRILPHVRSHDAFVRMFLDEARITAALSHPNIAQVYELGHQEDGLFLAMEFIAGRNLDQVTAAYERRQQPIPLGLSVAVMRDVCLALHSAHTFTNASGQHSPIVHRDVAQKNVMVAYDGVVKLLDFGIAKARDSLERTRAGMVKGTAGYMSPEQVRGEPLDGRSDLFAAGVVLWELVTGQQLFKAENPRDEMTSILDTPILPPLHASEPMPEELIAVILKALERDPKNRFQSGKEMARALERAAGRLMFDVDQRAAVMQELFEEKMAVTRELLESANAVVDSGPVMAALLQKPEPARKQGTQQKAGATRAPNPARGVDTEPSDKKARTPETRPAPRTTEDPAPGNRTLNIVLGVVVVVSILLGGGYLALILTHKLDADMPSAPAEKAAADPWLKPVPEPGPPVVAIGSPDAGTSASGTAVADAQGSQDGDKEATDGKEGEEKPSKPVRGPTGKMTLIINPEAEVFLGRRSLGKTPLFNVSLPEGTHLLRIVGPDKKSRKLSVPIEAGQKTLHRFSLDDIPTAR
ncbi:MAG TPA: serine/threonine-protein kinase [Hyalangium sp.]|nr:serine/threonine-protein kinase [Hyalangium sp.]